jgi:hypothetical protein
MIVGSSPVGNALARSRERRRVLAAQQRLHVALERPAHGVVLVEILRLAFAADLADPPMHAAGEILEIDERQDDADAGRPGSIEGYVEPPQRQLVIGRAVGAGGFDHRQAGKS